MAIAQRLRRKVRISRRVTEFARNISHPDFKSDI